MNGAEGRSGSESRMDSSTGATRKVVGRIEKEGGGGERQVGSWGASWEREHSCGPFADSCFVSGSAACCEKPHRRRRARPNAKQLG